MERAVLLEHLAAAKKHAERGWLLIDQQKQLIAALAETGANTGDAEKLLRTFEETQSCHLSDMQRILDVLDAMPPEGRRFG